MTIAPLITIIVRDMVKGRGRNASLDRATTMYWRWAALQNANTAKRSAIDRLYFLPDQVT